MSENSEMRFNNFKHILLSKFVGDKKMTEHRFKQKFGYDIDLKNPQTLNEKIHWLKLYDRKPIYSVWADKYGSRKYIAEHFGEEYLVPLIFKTDKVKELNPDNIHEFPCVVKSNHASGCYHIFRSADEIDWKQLRKDCKTWLKMNYYAQSQEWQYKKIKRYIIVEKMLQTKSGKIPNDYKLHYLDGKLAFIYCAIDREGDNYRQIYSPDWEVLPFTWDGKGKPQTNFTPIQKPKTLDKMLEIGQHFADKMHYVRVDFYDVDGKLYCGEITLHHGSGLDKFEPKEYDLKYGQMIDLTKSRG